jgi:hypothetical protein
MPVLICVGPLINSYVFYIERENVSAYSRSHKVNKTYIIKSRAHCIQTSVTAPICVRVPEARGDVRDLFQRGPRRDNCLEVSRNEEVDRARAEVVHLVRAVAGARRERGQGEEERCDGGDGFGVRTHSERVASR